jgi:hypothetical protein
VRLLAGDQWVHFDLLTLFPGQDSVRSKHRRRLADADQDLTRTVLFGQYRDR